MKTSSVADALELVNGVAPEELDRVVALLGRLDDLIRQITDTKNRTEPRNRRARRETL